MEACDGSDGREGGGDEVVNAQVAVSTYLFLRTVKGRGDENSNDDPESETHTYSIQINGHQPHLAGAVRGIEIRQGN